MNVYWLHATEWDKCDLIYRTKVHMVKPRECDHSYGVTLCGLLIPPEPSDQPLRIKRKRLFRSVKHKIKAPFWWGFDFDVTFTDSDPITCKLCQKFKEKYGYVGSASFAGR